MGLERIDSIYDLEKLGIEQAAYLELLKQSKEAIIDANKQRVTVKSTTVGDFAKQADDLDKAVKKSTASTQLGTKENARLTESIKAVNNVITQRFASEAKLESLLVKNGKATSDYNKQTIANRVETQKLNQEVKNTVQAEQAALGSRDRARAQIKVLTAEKDKLNLINADEAKRYDVLVGKLEKYENFLKRTGSAAEKQRLNIGNYPQVGNFSEAFAVLSKELDDVRAKLKTSLDPTNLKKLEQEEKLLTTITTNLGKSFTTPTSELRAFTNAAKIMGQEFGTSSNVFNQFVSEVGGKTDELKDIQATINFHASDTKYLDGIVQAVTGLAAAYGVAEASQELFGAGDQDLQKEMVKLQAILTLVTSMQTILNTVQTEGSAVQAAMAAKTAIMNAANTVRLALTSATVAATEAEVAAQVEQTTATSASTSSFALNGEAIEGAAAANIELATTADAGTVAMEAETAATEGAELATTSFATTLIATGIGALVVAIAAGVAYLVTKIQDWNNATASTAKAQADLAKTLSDLVSATKEYEAIRAFSAAAEIKSLESIINNRKAAGVTAAEGLALDKKLAAENLKNANEQAKTYNITAQTVKNAKNDAQSLADLVRLTEKQKRDYVEKTTKDQDANYDRRIEGFDELLTKTKESAAATKAVFDFANDTYQKQVDTQIQIDNIGVQEDKLNSDERRKFVLESVRIEADAVTAKNTLILSNERTTLKQRLDALRSNAAEQKAVINAELKDTLQDPTKSGVDKNLAIKKAGEERIKITNDTNRAVFDATEVDRKRRLAAELDLDKTLLDADKATQEEIIANQFGAVEKKVAAAQQAADDQEAILTKEYNHIRATTILSNEELLALNAKYNQDLIQLDTDTAKRVRDIEEKATQDYIAFIKMRSDAAYKEAADKVDISTNQQQEDIINSGVEEKAKAHGEKRAKIERQLQHELTQETQQGALDRLKILEDELDNELAAAILIEAPTKDIEARITANRLAQSKIRKGIVDDEADYEEQVRNERLTKDEGYAEAGLDLIQSVGDATIDKEKNKVAEQQKLIDEKAKADIDAVNASTRTEQEKADAITIIQARAAAEKKILDDRQKELDYRKAKFDKEIAILKIVAQIALDIATFNYVGAALAGAALIKLIATPIPKYKGGRGYGKQETAIVGDGGVSEYLVRESGAIEKTPAVPTLAHLMPRDRVFKSKDALMKELALFTMPPANMMAAAGAGTDLNKVATRIEDAISSIQIHTTEISKSGWRAHNRRLDQYDKWVAKYVK